MFSGTLSLTQENHHFIVQIGKNKCSQWTKYMLNKTLKNLINIHNMFGVGLAGIKTFKIFTFSR
jgi:hypothetical protein